ncbi:hypothetical protein CK203_059803 [Vitis vinifera]|uniref:Uncharacterized protein n=1 Tax=Vitis vinifera TaxID=29760 RepID=A0A438GB38_VITVI|nr:hypothetical protein CK203_059803 [Vitis vinifera]
MRGHSLQETKKDGRFHVHTKTYLDGAILKEEMERSADVLAAGLLEVADPSLSSKFYIRQHWMDESDGSGDSILKHKPLWATYASKRGKEKKKKTEKKQSDLHRTYGTRVIPVFVLSLADVDPHLMMEDESLVWTSNDVVIVLQHQNEKIPLRERGERRVPDGHEGDEEGEGFVGVRSRAKKGGFGVESKWFDVEVREQKGKEQVLIVERKGGISSWVRLGPKSIGSFIDGLEACIGNAGTGIWEKQWKDSGRSFLMVRSQNKGGLFIRLGVTDMGNKRFSIFIPKGNGSKNGWVLMAGLLRRLGCYDRETRLQAKGVTPLRSSMGKSYAEAVVYSEEKAIAVARVELGKRDLSRSMGKMAHCLVGSWDTSFEVGKI